MIKKLKRWLIERILPVWAREELLKEIDQLRDKNIKLLMECDRLNAYIEGLENGIRAQRRIVINNGEMKK
jgi:trehalose-6-phosphate synthase